MAHILVAHGLKQKIGVGFVRWELVRKPLVNGGNNGVESLVPVASVEEPIRSVKI